MNLAEVHDFLKGPRQGAASILQEAVISPPFKLINTSVQMLSVAQLAQLHGQTVC